MSGAHVITVEGLPAPWVLKRVMYQGQDITDSGLQADARQRFDNVVVTIADTASEISGVVRAAGGEPVADVLVVIVPLSERFWTPTSRRLGVLRTDTAGRYRLRGLPPGAYRAIASRDLDEGDVHRSGMLRDLSLAGTPLSIAGLDVQLLDLPLTSFDEVRRTSSR
jgi:hypothetical protein